MTHIPFRSWCELCVQASAPDDPHRRSEDEPAIDEAQLAAMLAVLSPVTALAQPVINAPFGEPVDEAMVEIDPRSVVEQYTGAFNARDVDRMESLMHPGIQIMEVSATGTDMVSEGYWAIVSHWLEHIEDADTPWSSGLILDPT